MLTASTLRLLADAAESHADDPREDTAESRRTVQALRIAADDARQVADSGSGYGTPETLALVIVIDNDAKMYHAHREATREVLDSGSENMTADLADRLKELVETWAGFEGVAARDVPGVITATALHGVDGGGYSLPDVTHALARAAFANVDWIDLANTYLDEMRTNG